LLDPPLSNCKISSADSPKVRPMLDDADIQIICQRIVSRQRCEEITLVSANRLMTEAEAVECYPIVCGSLRDIATVALMPSATLLGCRAKASVLMLTLNDDLSASLVADILMIVKDAGSGTLTFDELGEV
jgi:hypothetical protein